MAGQVICVPLGPRVSKSCASGLVVLLDGEALKGPGLRLVLGSYLPGPPVMLRMERKGRSDPTETRAGGVAETVIMAVTLF